MFTMLAHKSCATKTARTYNDLLPSIAIIYRQLTNE